MFLATGNVNNTKGQRMEFTDEDRTLFIQVAYKAYRLIGYRANEAYYLAKCDWTTLPCKLSAEQRKQCGIHYRLSSHE